MSESNLTVPTPVGTITLSPELEMSVSTDGSGSAAAAAPAPTVRTGYATQREVLLDGLIRYFTHDDFATLDKVLPIINREDVVSLRLVDWFVIERKARPSTGRSPR